MKLLEGKVAVVVGAGRGIGRDIAIAFAMEGATVVLAARTAGELEQTLDLMDQRGASASAKVTDVAQADQVRTLMEWTVETYGTIDVILNSAAIHGPIGPVWENDASHWARAIEINLLGSMYCARYGLPPMIAKKRGKLVFMSGGGSAYPRPHFSAYGASKAAVVRLGETIAEEVKPYNIQVNVMAPGPVNTQLFQEAVKAGEQAGTVAFTPPEKYTGLAVFLASEDSGTLTGKLIHVNDPWREMARDADRLNREAMYTLRRVQPPIPPSSTREEGQPGAT